MTVHALTWVAGLPLLEVTPEVGEIAAVYIQRRLMPSDPAGDALHLALASHHKCVTGHLRSRHP